MVKCIGMRLSVNETLPRQRDGGPLRQTRSAFNAVNAALAPALQNRISGEAGTADKVASSQSESAGTFG